MKQIDIFANVKGQVKSRQDILSPTSKFLQFVMSYISITYQSKVLELDLSHGECFLCTGEIVQIDLKALRGIYEGDRLC